MHKFASRKLIVTLFVLAICVGADLLGIDLSEDTLSSLVTVCLGFVGAQGLVDVATAIKAGKDLAGAVEGAGDADES